jgi:hypothetical protein
MTSFLRRRLFSKVLSPISLPTKPVVKLGFETLESRVVPASVPPGKYSGNFTSDTEFDQPGLYELTGSLSVNSGVTLKIGGAGVSVIIRDDVIVTVNGTLAVQNLTTDFKIDDLTSGDDGVVVASGGTMTANGATFSRTSFGSGISGVTVQSGGRLGLINSTFNNVDQVTLQPGSILDNGTPGQNPNNNAFLTTVLSVPILTVPQLTNNKQFAEIQILPGTLTGNSVTLGPIGSVTTANLVYRFTSTKFNVDGDASLFFAANSKVILSDDHILTVFGTLSVATGATVQVEDTTAGDDGVVVASGGTMTANGATFSRTSFGSGISGVTVQSGGRLGLINSTFNNVDQVTLQPGSILDNGTPGQNPNNNSFLTTPLTVPILTVPQLTNNKQFADVRILSGSLSNKTVALNPLGASGTQQFVFDGTKFSVESSGKLLVGQNAKVVIPDDHILTVTGLLDFATGATVQVEDTTGGDDGIVVASGGTMTANGVTISRLGFGASGISGVSVRTDGRLGLTNSTFNGLDQVTLQPGSILDNGTPGQNPNNNSFLTTPLTVPILTVPQLTDNKEFGTIFIGDSSLASGKEVSLNLLGTINTVNQVYEFTGTLFTVEAASKLFVGPNAKVILPDDHIMNVFGTVGVGAGAIVQARETGSGLEGIRVQSGGKLSAFGATFSRTGSDVSSSTSTVEVYDGGQLDIQGGKFTLDDIFTVSGSTATIKFANVDSTVFLNSGATLDVKQNNLSGANARVVASGTTGTKIDMTLNFWGTTDKAAVAGKITDVFDNSTLPEVLITPPDLIPNLATTTGVNKSVEFSSVDQIVTLTATVPSTGVVNEGTETFRIRSGLNLVGTPVTVNVVNGIATADYTIPAGTPRGTYVIESIYNGTANFSGFFDSNRRLTITPASSKTVAQDASVVFSPNSQSTKLVAAVTSNAGTVNEGSVTFTVLNGTVTVGSPQFANVSAGKAEVTYPLPAALAGGKYTIEAKFSGSTNVTASSDSSRFLSVNGAGTTTVAAALTGVTFSTVTQGIPVSADITSGVGTVNEGAVTFRLFQGTTTIAGPLNGTVANGKASAVLTLPAGTNSGSYSLESTYVGTSSFGGSSDTSKVLIVSPQATTTTAKSLVVDFKQTTQSLSVSTTVAATDKVTAGTVTFSVLDGVNVLVSGTANVSNGSAGTTLTLPAATNAGTYTITADYGGSINFTKSSDTKQTLQVNKATTATTVSPVTVDFSTAAQSPAVSAKLTSPGGDPTAGTVTFSVFDGANVVGSPVTVTVGGSIVNGTYPLAAGLAAGTYQIQAAYDGSPNYLKSTSAKESFVVGKLPTTTTAGGPVVTTFDTVDRKIDLTATVANKSAVVAGGSVTFTVLNGTVTIGSPVTVPLVDAAATAAYTLPGNTPAGDYSLRADYTGSGNFSPSQSALQLVRVSKAGTTIAVDPIGVSFSTTPTTATATAKVVSPSGVVTSGSVTFTILDGSTVVGSPVTVTVTSGSATGQVNVPAALTVGSYTIRGEYSGTTNLLGSIDTDALVVSQASTTITAESKSVTFSTLSQPVTLSAVLTSPAGTVNNGTVTFSVLDGTTVVGSSITVGVAKGSASGVYSLPAGLTAGTYTIRAEYGGFADLSPATDVSQLLTVNKAGTLVDPGSVSVSFSKSDSSTVVTAKITGADGIVSSGQVTFRLFNGTVGIGSPISVAVENGTASGNLIVPGGTAAGNYVLRAEFLGTVNLAPSIGTDTFTILPTSTTTIVSDSTAVIKLNVPQTVIFTAKVLSPSGTPSGPITFVLLNGTSPVGPTVTVNLSDGVGTTAYPLPTGFPVGKYTIQATYAENGSTASGTLTVNKGTVNIDVGNTSAAFNTMSQKTLR